MTIEVHSAVKSVLTAASVLSSLLAGVASAQTADAARPALLKPKLWR